jgi:hypothetical protein
VASALSVFADDVERHRGGGCAAPAAGLPLDHLRAPAGAPIGRRR